MMTPTLFDVASITGPSPFGKKIYPTLEINHEFDFERPNLKHYIVDHHVNDIKEVSDS